MDYSDTSLDKECREVKETWQVKNFLWKAETVINRKSKLIVAKPKLINQTQEEWQSINYVKIQIIFLVSAIWHPDGSY